MKEVPLDDISTSIDWEIANDLRNYCVPLLGIKSLENRDEDCKLCGTGTLVLVDGKHFILTAGHVWKALAKWPQISPLLKEYSTRSFIPTGNFHPQHVIYDPQCEEWGPDLALIGLPPSTAVGIAAHKSFVDLSKRREGMLSDPPSRESGLWALVGAIEEFSSRKQTNNKLDVKIEVRSFTSIVKESYERGDFDYLDLGAKVQLSGVPVDFGGLSGGGLWQLPLKMEGSTQKIVWNGEKHFHGVAFWQSSVEGDTKSIRCHGRKSLYDIAWRAWKLAE